MKEPTNCLKPPSEGGALIFDPKDLQNKSHENQDKQRRDQGGRKGLPNDVIIYNNRMLCLPMKSNFSDKDYVVACNEVKACLTQDEIESIVYIMKYKNSIGFVFSSENKRNEMIQEHEIEMVQTNCGIKRTN